jgi:hypothetical protein
VAARKRTNAEATAATSPRRRVTRRPRAASSDSDDDSDGDWGSTSGHDSTFARPPARTQARRLLSWCRELQQRWQHRRSRTPLSPPPRPLSPSPHHRPPRVATPPHKRATSDLCGMRRATVMRAAAAAHALTTVPAAAATMSGAATHTRDRVITRTTRRTPLVATTRITTVPTTTDVIPVVTHTALRTRPSRPGARRSPLLRLPSTRNVHSHLFMANHTTSLFCPRSNSLRSRLPPSTSLTCKRVAASALA